MLRATSFQSCRAGVLTVTIALLAGAAPSACTRVSTTLDDGSAEGPSPLRPVRVLIGAGERRMRFSCDAAVEVFSLAGTAEVGPDAGAVPAGAAPGTSAADAPDASRANKPADAAAAPSARTAEGTRIAILAANDWHIIEAAPHPRPLGDGRANENTAHGAVAYQRPEPASADAAPPPNGNVILIDGTPYADAAGRPFTDTQSGMRLARAGDPSAAGGRHAQADAAARPPAATIRVSFERADGWSRAVVYPGELHVGLRDDGLLETVNAVDIERYVACVVAAEVWPTFETEAYRAQAIITRTYVLYQMRRRGDAPYDVAATQASQVYRGLRRDRVGRRAAAATRFTRGLACTWSSNGEDKLFSTYYSAACGGMSQSAAIYSPADDVPPLRGGVPCDFCKDAPGQSYRWRPVSIDRADAFTRLTTRYPAAASLGGITAIEVVRRTPDGRPIELRITGENARASNRQSRSNDEDTPNRAATVRERARAESAGAGDSNRAVTVRERARAESARAGDSNRDATVRERAGSDSTSGAPNSTATVRERADDDRAGSDRGDSGRRTYDILAERFRLAMGGMEVRSTACDIRIDGDAIIFENGRGFGHGLGLCQWGMQAQAEQGKRAGEILRFYYPGSKLTRVY